MNAFHLPRWFLPWALFVCMLCSPAHAAAPTPDDQQLANFIRLYETDRSGVGRFYDLPWAPLRFDRLERLHQEWQERLGEVKFDELAQQGRIDYLLLRNELTAELTRLSRNRRKLTQMEELLPFREALQKLEQARWRMERVDMVAEASTVSSFADQIKKVRKRIEKGKKEKPSSDSKSSTDSSSEKKETSAGEKKSETEAKDASPPLKVSPELALRAASAVNDLRGTLKTWFTFYDGYQPEFSWWLKKPHDEAIAALESYAKFLREEIAEIKDKDEDPLIGEPIGADALAEDLAAEMIPYSAEELIAIGEREFAWCETRMKETARALGFGDDWKAALAKVKSQYVPPGQQDELVAEHAREAIQFLKERDLVTVPPLAEETWRLRMISPSGQKTLPFAAYGGQAIMVAYAKEEMKHEDKLMAMRGNNRHFTRIVTAHELIPGHHLQAFMAQRHREYRRMFSTPFLVEGWALYWEIRLWDLNYARTPEDKIGMLFWRMHRCARIIVSLKFHLGQMKPAEMVDYLVDRVGHERLGATGEVRRFIGGDYSPLYQCGYMIGGLQLRALHRELVEAGKLTEKQFNDAVLTYGPIPIELIRAGMVNVPLTRETKASWRFAGGEKTDN